MLKQLFNQYGCDKAKKHHYHTVYQPEFEPVKDQPLHILEVGVFKGDSTRAWIDYFPNVTIYGIDIFTRVQPEKIDILNHERVKWLKVDSLDPTSVNQIATEWNGVAFDIIIDDGLHTPAANGKTLSNLWRFLKPGGSYYVEDVWPLDIMTPTELSHWWLKKYPERYNQFEMNKFLNVVKTHAGDNVQRFDLRKFSGEGDSYIIKLTK